MATYLTIDDLEPAGRRVLLRSDLNVPLADGRVADDFRLRSALPAIRRLREAGAKVIICSHLGRPGGRPDPKLRMAPVAEHLAELGGFPVAASRDLVGPDARRLLAETGPEEVILLENTRFHPGETANDPGLADQLAGLADLFVMDAFGSAHRAHASTAGVAQRLRSAAGPLLEDELRAFRTLLEEPPRPFTVILGGAKISDKLPLLETILPIADAVLIGGGMCFSLLAAEGYETGRSLVEDDRLEQLRDLLEGEYGDRIVLPVDAAVADRFAPDASVRTVPIREIEDGDMGLDIGPETSARFATAVAGAGAVFWNGPLGVFEWERFRAGTQVVAQALAETSAFTVAGGGEVAAALCALGAADRVSHLSTGGGAALRLLQGRELPAVAALEKRA